MSTVKSSSANLTLNADGSGNDIKFQSNAVEKGSLTDGGVWIGSTFEPTGDTAASDNAAIGYTATEGLILTGQGSTNDVTIKNDADATVLEVATGGVDAELTAGNLVIGTAGKGIDFSAQTATSATGAATDSGGEVLDHYEEGTFTPAKRNPGTVTYTEQTGYYTRIGNVVHVWGVLTINSMGTATGSTLDGMPFTAAAGGGGGRWYVTYVGSLNKTVSAYVVGNIAALTDRIDTFQHNSTSGVTAMTPTTFSDGADLYFYGVYRA